MNLQLVSAREVLDCSLPMLQWGQTHYPHLEINLHMGADTNLVTTRDLCRWVVLDSRKWELLYDWVGFQYPGPLPDIIRADQKPLSQQCFGGFNSLRHKGALKAGSWRRQPVRKLGLCWIGGLMKMNMKAKLPPVKTGSHIALLRVTRP